MADKIREYASDDIEVRYSLKRCIHARECVNRLSAVFDPDKRPWIQPQNADADSIAQTIMHCPTGALYFERKDGGPAEPTPEKNTVQLVADGPLYVRGDVLLAEALKETRVALCRCGLSQNKPFCDNSHIEAGFKAADTCNESDLRETTGEALMKINLAENGPLLVYGDFEVLDGAGAVVFKGSSAALCRCGNSENKPFCDGTHRKIGFEATSTL